MEWLWSEDSGTVAEGFRLIDPDGEMIACPEPQVDFDLKIVGAGNDDDNEPAAAITGDLTGGCTAAPAAPGWPGALLLLLCLTLCSPFRGGARIRRRGN